MPLGRARDRILTGLARRRGRPHRYVYWRWGVGIAFTLAIAALPAFDLLRIDLWGGHHQYLGRELGLVEAAKRFAFPFLGINIAILIASRFLGRYLCGFVCPYGAVARLADWLRLRSHSRAERMAGHALLLGVCATLCTIALAFWIDGRVFRDGSTLAIAISASLLAVMVATFYAMARNVGLDFCRNWCPSGVYFAVLGPETRNGIEFVHPEACTDCKACEAVCPMDLAPREMPVEPAPVERGFYPESLSSVSLCIRCGDCVVACEGTTARSALPTPLRMGWLSRPLAPATGDASEEETGGGAGSSVLEVAAHALREPSEKKS